jgi:hypothetical protein
MRTVGTDYPKTVTAADLLHFATWIELVMQTATEGGPDEHFVVMVARDTGAGAGR